MERERVDDIVLDALIAQDHSSSEHRHPLRNASIIPLLNLNANHLTMSGAIHGTLARAVHPETSNPIGRSKDPRIMMAVSKYQRRTSCNGDGWTHVNDTQVCPSHHFYS